MKGDGYYSQRVSLSRHGSTVRSGKGLRGARKHSIATARGVEEEREEIISSIGFDENRASTPLLLKDFVGGENHRRQVCERAASEWGGKRKRRFPLKEWAGDI